MPLTMTFFSPSKTPEINVSQVRMIREGDTVPVLESFKVTHYLEEAMLEEYAPSSYPSPPWWAFKLGNQWLDHRSMNIRQAHVSSRVQKCGFRDSTPFDGGLWPKDHRCHTGFPWHGSPIHRWLHRRCLP